MIKNYLKIAWRSLVKNFGYSVVTIAGLSIGITACLIISIYVQREWSYDRFHENSDRIYRVTREISEEGASRWSGVLEGPFASNIVKDLPEVETAFRILQKNKTLLRHGEKSIYENRAFYTDPAIFKVFDIPIISGNKKGLLREPGTIVITESLAERLFGNEQAVGQTLYLDRDTDPYRVSAVVRGFPENSHIVFGFLLPMPEQIYGLDQSQWAGLSAFYTYLLLSENTNRGAVEKKLPLWGKSYYEEGHFKTHSYRLQALADIHLYSNLEQEVQPERIGEVSYIYIFASVAILILIIAVINYINLMTVRSVDRTREIGVRKVLGAEAKNIRYQFMGESFLVVVLAVILAFVFSEFLLGFVNDLLQLSLEFNYLENIPLLALLLILVFGTVLLSGFYPVLVLSRLSPVGSLKGKTTPLGKDSGSAVRKGMVAFQFCISVLLVICTLIVWNQLNFVQNTRLGLEKDRVISLVIPNRTPASLFNALKEKVKNLSGVEDVTASSTVPSKITGPVRAEVNGEMMQVNNNIVDDNYFDVLGMTLVSGTGFKDQSPQQLRFKAVVNEAFIRAAGWNKEEVIGKKIPVLRLPLEIVGVVGDFHYESFREQIAPQIIQYHHSEAALGYLSARFNTASLANLLPALQKNWEEIYPSYPFEYFFLEDSFEKLYTSDRRLANTFSVFAGLAILISVLGLLSLVGYAVRKRQKEIGIRKVMGATTERILMLLTADFVKLILIGFVVAVPVSWYLMNWWLADFAYRIELGPAPFVFAGITIVLVSVLIISWQSFKTARMNPVDSLRSE